MDQDQTVSDLRREIGGLRFGIFIAASAALALLTLWNVFNISFIPKFMRIFEDMLASSSKLLELTKLIIAYGNGAEGILPYALVLSCSALSFAIMNWMRRSWKFILVAVAAILLLALHAIVLNVALYAPLIQIIQGINEK